MNSDDFYSNYLEFFESEEPLFYESPRFRQVLPKLFRRSVERKIANVLWIPSGQRFENPEIDDIRDETFAKCQWQLDGDQIVNGDMKVNRNNTGKWDSTPISRYFNCRRSVLRIATNASVRAARRNGRPWYHGEFSDDLLSDEYCRRLRDSADASSSQDDKPNFLKLREELGSKVKDLDFEMFRLKHEEGMQPREINELYKELTPNRISVKICRVKKAVKILLRDPSVVRRLRGEENEQCK